MLAQHLRHGQDQVGGGDPLTQFAGQLKTHHVGDQHRDRLSEHRRLGFYAADAPAQHAKAVNHGGMRVGAHQRIGIGNLLAVLLFMPYSLTEIFKVDLMANTGTRWHHAKTVKSFLSPTQKEITLMVASHLQLDVLGKSLLITKGIDGNRVVDHQVHRRQRINLIHIPAQALYRLSHGSKVNHGRYTGKVLHQHSRRAIGYFALGMAVFLPIDNCLQVSLGDGFTVQVTQQVFQ